METPYRNKPPEAYIAEIEDLKQEIAKLQKPSLWQRLKTWWKSWNVANKQPGSVSSTEDLIRNNSIARTQVVIGDNIVAVGDVTGNITVDGVSVTYDCYDAKTLEAVRKKRKKLEEKLEERMCRLNERLEDNNRDFEERMQRFHQELEDRRLEREERFRQRMLRTQDRIKRRTW